MFNKLTKQNIFACTLATSFIFIIDVNAEGYSPYPGKLPAKLVNVATASVIDLEAETWPGYSKTFRVSLPDIQVPSSQASTVCQRKLAEKAKTFAEDYLAKANSITLSDLQMSNSGDQSISGQIHTNEGSLVDALKRNGYARSPNDQKPWC